MNLPANWEERDLATLCSVLTDGAHHSPKHDPLGEVPYITAKHIKWSGIDLKGLTYVSRHAHESIFKRCPVSKGDVLLIKDGATTGIAAINHIEAPFSMLSSVALIRPRQDVLTNTYLWHWLRSPEAQRALLGAMNGTAIRRLTLTTIGQTLVPLPPLAEQRRIVTKLDALNARLTRARVELERVVRLSKIGRQRLLKSAFCDELTNDYRNLLPVELHIENIVKRNEKANSEQLPGTWTLTALNAVAEVTGGLTKSSKRDALSLKRRYLRVANVYANSLKLEDVAEIGCTEKEFIKTKLIAGDLLVVEGNGSLDQVGRVAIWNEELPECSHQNHLIRVRAKSQLLPKYALFYLLSPIGRAYLERLASSTSGLHTLSISKVGGIPIPLPSLEEQAVIIGRLEIAFACADRLEADAGRAQALLDRLEAAILAKAFYGKLVPQDLADEPASVMLERNRVPQVAAPKAKRGRRSSSDRL